MSFVRALGMAVGAGLLVLVTILLILVSLNGVHRTVEQLGSRDVQIQVALVPFLLAFAVSARWLLMVLIQEKRK